MRKLLLVSTAALALVGTLPARAAGPEAGLTGSWFSDATGETIVFNKTSDGATATFAGIGEAKLTQTTEKNATLKLTFKSGLLGLSSTDCYYAVRFFDKDRMGWTVVDGGDKCPRGTFTLIPAGKAPPAQTAEAPPVAPPAVAPPVATEQPPAQPDPVEMRGRTARSVEQITGAWADKASGAQLVIKSGFAHSYEIWTSHAGQGGLSMLPDSQDVMRVSFQSGKECAFQAKLSGDKMQILPAMGRCPFVGNYERARR